jgi:hypothetical protein
MIRYVVALVLGGAAAAVAALLARRKRPASEQVQSGSRWPVPHQVDRGDFVRADAPWLVVVFSSSACDSCARTVAAAKALESPAVAVHDCEAIGEKVLHQRYRIEAVPITIVADATGAVRASFVGPPTATDLWAVVAELREPGSTPRQDECQGDDRGG